MKNWHIYAVLVVFIIIILVLLRGSGGGGGQTPDKITRFDDFAQCIADSGTLFYGAYSCPHCQDQKEMFDDSDKLPYIECATVGGVQTKECRDAGIEAYPTWVWPDGTRVEGLLPFETLAENTGCQLPE